MLAKKKDVFFDTLEEISLNILASAEYFAQSLSKQIDPAEVAKTMKEYETKGDRCIHRIVTELNKTFLTPIDREDILALAGSLDDVLDEMEAVASRFDMYNLRSVDDSVIRMADILLRCAREIRDAMVLLSSKKLLPIREHAIRLNELENEADDILRISIKQLFIEVKDPIELIKKKELYEMLEEATDCCEDVANTLETIIMRNS
ncbi:DUF47 domain-containing protein [Paenibacillus thermoaerophilus]|uniref:DUF47 domain-containing protein n=1 Tax=Paenibacillus thermoaerophilus TaxID=1215385 RepID=A0ABW2V3C9_9BACL|nr:DUF47 family protein [Paenibacillus thermoaerophilus]TMV18211.1 DUF47 domain-containing protein [Paenibacillus thermoaerophilus]